MKVDAVNREKSRNPYKVRSATRPAHQMLNLLVGRSQRRFAAGTRQLEAQQRRRLQGLLGQVAAAGRGRSAGISSRWSWEEFSRRLPVTDYTDWESAIEVQRRDRLPWLSDSPVEYYQPSGGYPGRIKWIPRTRAFIRELNAAMGPWIADMYRQQPGIGEGVHYWSTPWLPPELRGEHGQDAGDDMQFMSPLKRWVADAIQAVPREAGRVDSTEDSLFATLACLAAHRDLTLLSIWSPAFGLRLLQGLAQNRDELAMVLRRGDWGRRTGIGATVVCPRSPRAAGMLEQWDGSLNAAFFREFWPRLQRVSAWDAAASSNGARRLRALLPQAAFQGRGLCATEAVITVPWQGLYPLAYRSHVYEFEDPEDGRIHAPWEVRSGQTLVPVVSTGSGLLRYRLDDLVRVEEFLGQVPCLRFMGRSHGTDLVGERLGRSLVRDMLNELQGLDVLRPVSLVGFDDVGEGRPGYALLLEPACDQVGQDHLGSIAGELEKRLLKYAHYRLARHLGQLAPLRCLAHPRMQDLFDRHFDMHDGLVRDDASTELHHWQGSMPAPLLHGSTGRVSA